MVGPWLRTGVSEVGEMFLGGGEKHRGMVGTDGDMMRCSARNAAALQQESSVGAPWSMTVNINSLLMAAGVQDRVGGASITCRVTVDS